MAENYLRIGRTDFFIKSDRLSWIVARRLKCGKCKSFPDGHKMANETYHTRLSGAFERVFDEITRTTSVETLDDILRVCEETYAMLKRVLDRDFEDRRSAA